MWIAFHDLFKTSQCITWRKPLKRKNKKPLKNLYSFKVAFIGLYLHKAMIPAVFFKIDARLAFSGSMQNIYSEDNITDKVRWFQRERLYSPYSSKTLPSRIDKQIAHLSNLWCGAFRKLIAVLRGAKKEALFAILSRDCW